MFSSILFPRCKACDEPQQVSEPMCFKDLCLDQMFSRVLKNKQQFHLERFFYTMIQDREIISYRQDIMKEIENEKIYTMLSDFSRSISDFAICIDITRKELQSSDHWENNYLTKGHFLDYADRYCETVSTLKSELTKQNVHANGLVELRAYLSSYCSSESYISLHSRIQKLREELSTVHYCMLIQNGSIRVRKYEGQANHSAQILDCFEKFRQGNVQDYRCKISEEPSAVHVEAAVLDLLAKLYKDIFADLNDFCSQFFNFADKTILRFAEEVQFYIAWIDFIRPIQKAGLPFTYPKLEDNPEHSYDLDAFDLMLASQILEKTVTNDFELTTPEQIIVITGPNQGGKTTFARAYGQIHYLAALGLSVPGREAVLRLPDQIFTHFESQEDVSTLNGKLKDDLLRLKSILFAASSQSLIVINEIFSSTTLSDALLLGGKVMDIFAEKKLQAVVVTFLDELANHGPETVSMMSTIKEASCMERSYKIVRKPPDGLAYTLSLADKHGLTYEKLFRRIGQ